MSIVKLDPSRPSVVSVARNASPTVLPQSPASSMLMVSSAMRTTRRASMMAASHLDFAGAAAKHEELTPVKEAPLIVPVTDTLDKSEVHLLSDILSRGDFDRIDCSLMLTDLLTD